MPKQADTHTITPRLPRALPTHARNLVKTAINAHLAAVDALIAFLDDADGDADLEPSLGSAQSDWQPERLNQEHWADGTTDDAEGEHDGREPSEDAEGSLGWTMFIDQTKNYPTDWLYIGGNDLELDPSRNEPDFVPAFVLNQAKQRPLSKPHAANSNS